MPSCNFPQTAKLANSASSSSWIQLAIVFALWLAICMSSWDIIRQRHLFLAVYACIYIYSICEQLYARSFWKLYLTNCLWEFRQIYNLVAPMNWLDYQVEGSKVEVTENLFSERIPVDSSLSRIIEFGYYGYMCVRMCICMCIYVCMHFHIIAVSIQLMPLHMLDIKCLSVWFSVWCMF